MSAILISLLNVLTIEEGAITVIITRLRIQNLKCIKNIDIDLKPLTIFVGPSASGKSTILHAIYWFYLKALNNTTLTNEIPSEEKAFFNVSSYDDLALGRDLRRVEMGVELELSVSSHIKKYAEDLAEDVNWERLNLKKPEFSHLTVGFKLHRHEGGSLEYWLHTALDSLDIQIENRYSAVKRAREVTVKGSLEGGIEKSIPHSLLGSYYLTKFFPTSKYPKEFVEEIEKLDIFLDEIFKKLREELCKSFFLLTPLRGAVPLSSKAEEKTRLGINGEGLLEALASVYASYDSRRREELGSLLDTWAKRFGISCLVAGLYGKELRATFKDPSSPEPIDLAMGSHGQKQLTTLLTQLIIAPPHSSLMVEEPEISAHPNIQALLPLFFAEIIKKHNKQLLVTTHSSILVLALSDAIMGSEDYPDVPRLDVNDVAIYHVVRDKESGYTKVEPLELTKEGLVKGGVPSFVDVEAKLYGRIMERIR